MSICVRGNTKIKKLVLHPNHNSTSARIIIQPYNYKVHVLQYATLDSIMNQHHQIVLLIISHIGLLIVMGRPCHHDPHISILWHFVCHLVFFHVLPNVHLF